MYRFKFWWLALGKHKTKNLPAKPAGVWAVFASVMCASVMFAGVNESVNANSLYDPSRFQALHEDKKAYREGDGVTILIYENTQATTSAGEGSGGDFSVSGSATVDERNWRSGVNLGSSADGSAQTNRNGFIKAQITAQVTHVDAAQNLYIEGVQQITINDESQVIKIKGKVRPEDVSNTNTVPSYRIQNAEISIDGDGSVSNGKNSNVLARFVKWLGF